MSGLQTNGKNGLVRIILIGALGFLQTLILAAIGWVGNELLRARDERARLTSDVRTLIMRIDRVEPMTERHEAELTRRQDIINQLVDKEIIKERK